MKGKKATDANTPEDEEEVDELDEDRVSSDEEEIPPIKIKAGPKSVQKKMKEVKFDLPKKGTAKPTSSGLIPFVEVPAVKPAIREPTDFVKKTSVDQHKGPAYYNKAPIDEGLQDDILKRLDDLIVEIKQGDLLRSVKPAIRKDYIKHLTRRRVMNEENLRESNTVGKVEDVSDDKEEYLDIHLLPDPSYVIIDQDGGDLPHGSVVLTDPVEQFLNSLGPDEVAPKIVVARESHALKALYPIINGVAREECLIDGGSQIVSMSLETAQKLHLSWDPSIVIHMQSANQSVEPTQGLAKNVPFVFNEITVYLQVHIINKVAYNVLLGRPWEVLTESRVENFADGSQHVTLTDPNTKKKSTMPSYDRGKPPDVLKKIPKESSFQSSMN